MNILWTSDLLSIKYIIILKSLKIQYGHRIRYFDHINGIAVLTKHVYFEKLL